MGLGAARVRRGRRGARARLQPRARRLHTDWGFALAWGAFPALTGYFVEAQTLRARGGRGGRSTRSRSILVQRALSTPVRAARRERATTDGHGAARARAAPARGRGDRCSPSPSWPRAYDDARDRRSHRRRRRRRRSPCSRSSPASLVLRKARAHERLLETRDRARQGDASTRSSRRSSRSARERARARRSRALRADSLSQLADEERRIAEERRRDVAERERDATAQLGEQLVAAQGAVEQRLADWTSDVEKLQESLADELERIEAKQRQLMAEVEAKIGQDADGLQRRSRGAAHGSSRGCARSSRARAGGDCSRRTPSSSSTPPSGASALHEVAERLRRRERELQELIEREENDAAQRIQLALGDVERRQVEQLQRIVGARDGAVLRGGVCSSSTPRSAPRARRPRAGSQPRARPRGRAVRPRGGGGARGAAQRGQRRGGAARRGAARPAAGRTRAPARRRARLARGPRAPGRGRACASVCTRSRADAESERAVLDARLHELARRLDELALENVRILRRASNFRWQGSSRRERNTPTHGADDRTPPVRARKGRVLAAARADRGRLSAAARRDGSRTRRPTCTAPSSSSAPAARSRPPPRSCSRRRRAQRASTITSIS